MSIKRRTRTLGAFALAATTMLVVTSCSSAAEPEEPTGPVSLRMVTWTSDQAQLDLLNAIGEAYVAQSDNKVDKVTFDSTTADAVETVLTTQLSSNDPPDLSWLRIDMSRDMVKSGALFRLDDVFKADSDYDFGDLIPEFQTSWLDDDGSQYAIPFSTGPYVMFYNEDLYTAAGIPNPTEMREADDWDWAHFREASRTIAETQGVPGWVLNAFEFKDWSRLAPLMYAYGATPWDEKTASCTMDTPEMKKALDLFHGMLYEDKSVPLPGQQTNFWGGQGGATSAFLSASSLLKDATFNWGIAPMPSGPAGSLGTNGQAAIGVFAGGKNPEIAADFLAFMTNPENSAKLAAFYPPARKSLRTAEIMAENNPIVTAEQLAPIFGGDERPIPVSINAGAINDVLNRTFGETLYAEDGQVNDAINAVCEGINPLLQG